LHGTFVKLSFGILKLFNSIAPASKSSFVERVFKKSVILCRQKPNHKEKSDLQGREISAHWTGNHYDEQEI